MAIVTVHQAKTQLSKLICRAEAGEEIFIARGREPASSLRGGKATPNAVRAMRGLYHRRKLDRRLAPWHENFFARLGSAISFDNCVSPMDVTIAMAQPDWLANS